MQRDRVQLLVRFGYDGGRFCGLQPQPDVPTAGAALRARFLAAGVEPKALSWAARTDSGVHAERNAATCWLRGVSDVDAVLACIADPRDDGLSNVALLRVPVNVHARASSRGKHYRYIFEDGWPPAPEQAARAWRIHPRLDAERMHRAAQHLVGEHDFHTFRTPRCSAPDPVKRLTALAVTSSPGEQGSRIVLDVHGQSFLRQMVRIIAGTLAEIGAGLRSPADVPAMLAARERTAAGITAPPHALTLVDVHIAV